MPKRLTVQDKIIIHLSGYTRFADEFECPEDISQAGIAEAIGKSRAHTTLELKRLKESEMVSERLSHVKGAKVKKKVYQLSGAGVSNAMNLKKTLDDVRVNVDVEGKISEMSGRDALDELKRTGGFSDISAFERVIGVEDVIKIGELATHGVSIGGGTATAGIATGRSAAAGGTAADSGAAVAEQRPSATAVDLQNYPKVDVFFGREAELAEMNSFLRGPGARVLSVIGMHGIGKTALASKVIVEYSSAFKIFYIKLYNFDSGATVAQQLARFLAGAGKPELLKYMENRLEPDMREVGWHVENSLAGQKFLFIVDDYEASEGTLDSFLNLLSEILTSRDEAHMMVLSAKRPTFYSTKELAQDKTVMELNIAGLDMVAATELLKSRGVITGPDAVRRVVEAVDGHPLALELVAPDSELMGADSPVQNLEELYLNQITRNVPESREFLSLCSVLRKSFKPLAMKLFGFEREAGLASHAMFLRFNDGSAMLHRVVASAIISHLGPVGLQNSHKSAAEFCEESGEEPIEVLYHLVNAGLEDNAARFALGADDYLLSGQNLGEALALLEGLDVENGSLNSEILNLLAEMNNLAGNWEEAATVSEKLAVPDAPGESRPEGVAPKTIQIKALIRLASIRNKQGEREAAIEFADAAIELCDPVNDPEGGASAFYTKGTILRDSGSFEEAMVCLKKAVNLGLRSGDKTTVLRSLMEKGIVEASIHDFEGAEEDLAMALEEALAADSKIDEGRIRLNLGWLKILQEDAESAAKYYQEARDFGVEIGQPRLTGYALAALGDCHNLQNSPEKGIEMSKAALDIFERLGVRDMTAVAYSNIGTGHSKLGEGEESEKFHKLAIATLDGLNVPLIEGQIFFEYGISSKELGNLAGAKEMLASALDIYKNLGIRQEVEKVEAALDNL